MEAEAAHRLVGQKLGAYRIDSLLGEGAMGEVFRGVHEALGRPVAVKTLKPQVAADRSLMERFFAEARAVNIIRHENIVECTDLVNDPGGQSYILMELLEGRTLAQAIRDGGRLPARRAARIAVQIADAIGAAHDKGIIHRDLKPDNVFLISRAGTSDYVKVLDFGIARLRPELGVTATQSGALVGTPAYMSPEQVKGEKALPASDLYALGVIIFQMLTGRLPFAAPSVTLMLMAHLNDSPVRVDTVAADVPKPLVDLIARVLAKEPAQRPASMAELRVALLEAVGLPIDLTASVVGSGKPAARATAVSLEATLASDSSPVGAAVPRAVPAAPSPRRWLPWVIAGGLATAALIAIVTSRGGGDTKVPAAATAGDAGAPVAPAAAKTPTDAAVAPVAISTSPASAPDAGVTAAPPAKPPTARRTAKKPPPTDPVTPPVEPPKDPPKEARDPTKRLIPPTDDR